MAITTVGISAKRDAATYRREVIASMRARRMSENEIHRALAKLEPPIICSIGTVNRDIKRIREEWRERTGDSVQVWLAAELATLHELERAAWEAGKLDIVIRCLERRARMLGLDKPADARTMNIDLSSLSTEQLQRLAAGEDLLKVLAEALPKPEPQRPGDGR